MGKKRYVLSDVESANEEKQNRVRLILTELLLAMGILGVFFCFLTETRERWILALVMLGLIGYRGITFSLQKGREAANALPIIAGLILVVIRPIDAIAGFLTFCNQWIELMNQTFDQLIPKLQNQDAAMFGRMQIFLFLLLVTGSWMIGQTEQKKMHWMSMGVIGILLITSIFHLNLEPILTIGLLMGWMLLWTSCYSVQRCISRKIIACVTSLAAAIVIGYFGIGYAGNQSVQTIKNSIQEKVEQTRYGKDTLPQGDLTKANTMQGDKDDTMLVIHTDHPQQMYLKGFVGSILDGAKWQELAYSNYTDEEIALLHRLEKQSFATNLQYKNYMEYTGNAEDVTPYEVTIQNVDANRKYVYLPYETKEINLAGSEMNRHYQWKSTALFGSSTYSFTDYEPVPSAEALLAEKWDEKIEGTEEYSQEEQVYRAYAHENYMDITSEQTEAVQEYFFDNTDWSTSGIYRITEQIRLKLQEKTTYQDEPKKYTGAADFLTWFLEQEKSGNSAYYATAAVLAYRAVQIPARYVEGYYLSAADAKKFSENGATEIPLTQQNAHAWVEIYLDGIGWMPIEVAPGYYYAEYTTQQIVGAPESSVNIVNEMEEDQLEGNTTDQLQNPENEQSGDEIPESAKKVIHIVGMVLLLVLILWGLHILMLLRYHVIWRMHKIRMKKANSIVKSRLHYQHVHDVFCQTGKEAKGKSSYDNIARLLELCPDVQEFECKRFIELIQKTVFGEIELTEAELLTVTIFDEKVSQLLYDQMTFRQRWRTRYWFALM